MKNEEDKKEKASKIEAINVFKDFVNIKREWQTARKSNGYKRKAPIKGYTEKLEIDLLKEKDIIFKMNLTDYFNKMEKFIRNADLNGYIDWIAVEDKKEFIWLCGDRNLIIDKKNHAALYNLYWTLKSGNDTILYYNDKEGAIRFGVGFIGVMENDNIIINKMYLKSGYLSHGYGLKKEEKIRKIYKMISKDLGDGEGDHVHHVDLNPLNNRIDNLDKVTMETNTKGGNKKLYRKWRDYDVNIWLFYENELVDEIKKNHNLFRKKLENDVHDLIRGKEPLKKKNLWDCSWGHLFSDVRFNNKFKLFYSKIKGKIDFFDSEKIIKERIVSNVNDLITRNNNGYFFINGKRYEMIFWTAKFDPDLDMLCKLIKKKKILKK